MVAESQRVVASQSCAPCHLDAGYSLSFHLQLRNLRALLPDELTKRDDFFQPTSITMHVTSLEVSSHVCIQEFVDTLHECLCDRTTQSREKHLRRQTLQLLLGML